MIYGEELIKKLEDEIKLMQDAISDRMDRIGKGMTDWEDCFMSQRCEERGIRNNQEKIDLIRRGGFGWFREYATLDGALVEARWCNTKYGTSLRAVMPDGSVVWTSSNTKKGLAKKGLKAVQCKRPAWFAFKGQGGMLGVYTGDYIEFPSDVNYATGEPAGSDPVEIKDIED